MTEVPYTGLLSSVSDRRSAGVLLAELLGTARSPVLGGTNPRTGRLADRRHRFLLLLFRILGHLFSSLLQVRVPQSPNTYPSAGRHSIS